MGKKKMRNKRRRLLLLPVLLLSLLLVWSAALPAFSDDAIVFDDYVGASGMTETVVDSTNTNSVTQNEVDAENNDGDDTYISNNGTVFQIPRPADTSARVYDYADLFTDEEEASITEKILDLQNKKDADIVILTSNDVPTDAYYSVETSMRYARQFLVDNNFKEDSIICIIDMNNRVFWAAGYGKYGSKKYSGWGQKVYDLARNDLSNRNYGKVAIIYLDQINRLDNLLMAAIPTPLSLLISAGAALLVLLILILHHSSTQPSKANTPAVEVMDYVSLRHDKQYLGTTVHKRHIPRNTGGGGGGGGFSGGGFSSGSGGSHSGGGGHF